MNAKHSIGYAELRALKLFHSDFAVASFILYYQDRYATGFLKPVALTKYGIPARNKEERIAALVERRIATLLGRNPVSLQDFAVAAVRRRQTGANTLQKESSKQATNSPDVSSLPRSSTDEAAQKNGGEAGRPGTLWSGCGLRKVVDIRAVADTVLTADSPPTTARTLDFAVAAVRSGKREPTPLKRQAASRLNGCQARQGKAVRLKRL